ncbi:MAG: uroporphyrinogen-III C-methyltransferase, partial [Candidatus Omnitrophica bacterium]|nr:uroporphyrinogen-III C-methyltransferase [Candidatus Omnitrophota bacterium]
MGFVSLIGAGPGDPGLVTVRALEKLRTCEAVVHDRLIPYQLLDEVPAGAERIDVGKHPGKAKVPQEKIQEILIAKAREGKRVVRLKGGDPGIFGRVGEEIEALQDAGIPFEVVPGVTAGIAAAAAAGIPLTHRDIASSVTFVTGHEDPEREDSHLDWGEMARAGTLVFYMIGKHLPDIGERLIESGRPEATPALIVREEIYPLPPLAVPTL